MIGLFFIAVIILLIIAFDLELDRDDLDDRLDDYNENPR